MKSVLISILLILNFSTYSQENSGKKSEDTSDVVNFENIQDVLKNDKLSDEVDKKIKKKVEKKQKIKVNRIKKYNIPSEYTFWTFMSEYWLIKNVIFLKWDFQKPDYGLVKAFQEFLERMGVYEKKFKILLLNTPEITHFALPSNKDEIIFLLSVPFIRTLDLSKLEIALLMFEDYLRWEEGYFKEYVKFPALNKMIGSNFYQKKFDSKVLKDTLAKYDQMTSDKGFDYQQQFAITSKMNKILKDDNKLWNSYYRMIQKIDNLVKTNILYQKYLKIYPSPEMQLNWLRPKSDIKPF
ncbi:MAG: hypothetical protein GY909_05620 [Oligoflexia bacterium]|nr:hypothetical protein [Oligoflexia bacterium]